MIHPLDMTGRTVLVTGASSGIGRETSILLAELGARVILVGRDAGRLQATADRTGAQAARVEPFDLNQLDEIPAWMKRVAATAGLIDGVVHCAGLQQTLPLRQVTAEAIESHLRVNVSAAIALAKGFRQKGVRSEAGGSLVLISSVMGMVGSPGRSVYSAGKGAIVGLTRSLALELARDGIRVNCVAPAFVKGEMLDELAAVLGAEPVAAIEARHPLGFGQPRDVANSIAFLLAGTARWITGSTLVVDGGYTAQ